MTAAALALHSLVRRYPGAARAALDDVSLDVRPGELVALVGESGAGKTTTLRLVAGFERPDAGAVLLDGADVTRLPPERRDVGMVFQHHALFPHLTVEENVAFGLASRGVSASDRRARARAALAAMGLDGAERRAVHALSGGEQQRVALARALVVEPRVLLLDEPLSSLDPALRAELRDVVRDAVRGAHVTALLVTHDQDDAFAVADRVAVLRGGRLLQVGAPEELYDRPASRDVAAFVGRAALLPARRAAGDALVTVGGVTQRACADAPSADGAADAASAGARWLAVLRPESLALASPDDDGAWPGEVVARRFAGAVTVYRVRLADDRVVEIDAPRRDAREGDRVAVRVVAPRVAVVRDEAAP